MKNRLNYFFFSAGCLLLFDSCSREIVIREYSEEIRKPTLIESAFEGSGRLVNNSNPLIWELPLGWKTLPADGIRVAAFQTKKALFTAETTLVILASQAGSIEDNITRWLGQLNLPVNNEIIDQIILNSQEFETKGMIIFQSFDFTDFTDKDQESMIVAIGTIPNQTLFVKIKGPHSLLVKESTRFFSLLQSIALSN